VDPRLRSARRVTLTLPQAFVRRASHRRPAAAITAAAAEMMAPKWFDKNLDLSNENNCQLREVLRLRAMLIWRTNSPASAFGHFARHYEHPPARLRRQGLQPAARQLRARR